MVPAATVRPDVTRRVVLLCFLGILAEGYDVGVMGAILPTLATDPHWRLSPLELGTLTSYALLGMLVGGALCGTLSDMYGRKRLFVACLALFSVSMGAAAVAPTPGWFGLARFVGGIGLGGIIPVAAALTLEYSPDARKSLNYGLMYSGYSLGLVAAALAAMAVVPVWGWRGVVALGVVPLLLVPAVARWLPESVESLVARGDLAGAGRLAAALGLPAGSLPAPAARPVPLGLRRALALMFGPGRRRATACFWVSLFMGMLLVYGLGAWLPQIMRRSGYDLGPALMFLAVFALSSAAGGIVMGQLADRRGVRLVVGVSFLIGAVAIDALGFKGPMALTYALVAVAGIGTVSASLVLCSLVANYFEPEARATVLGWALSFARLGAICGPVIAGAVQQWGGGPLWSFHVFAGAALIAGVAVLLIPARVPQVVRPAAAGAIPLPAGRAG